MMRKSLVIFAVMVMNAMVCNAQGFSQADAEAFDNMNFEWNAKVVKAAPAAKTATRTVSVRQLAQASARRNSSSTASTRSTRRASAAQQTYAAAPVAQNVVPQNDVQAQLNSALAANSSQRVICGTVEHNYINDINGTTTLIVRTAGFGGSIRKFTMRGYRDYVIPVYAGDYVCFIATYGQNGMNEYPLVRYNELVNVTGTNRYLHVCVTTNP